MYIDPDADAPGGQERMIVPLDTLVQYMNGIEGERDRVSDWLRANSRRMTKIPPPGNDPCSIDTMKLMSQKGQEAVDAALAYVDRLNTTAQKLRETAVSYGLIEEDTANSFRRGPV